ncbi:MAG: TIGR04141 family sporadically distributed protein [Planctomycetes bacterium]|nr:TIGR04141 family sporadically distributed protein [Planctomycetota bacterium]MCW8137395.1 TIGR04141 family sporadically distributed protein [Planctomycetota bacterium]
MAKQHVTLYRLKPDVKTFDAAIKGKPPRVLDLDRSAFDFDARLYVEDTDPREPRWAAFVRDGFGSLNFAKSPTVRAALLLKVKGVGSLYAITFSGGRYMLTDDAIERSFGLRTALNVIFENDTTDAPVSRLRRVDAKTVSANTLHVNRQANKGADFDAFGIDIRRDLLGGVTGEPADTKKWGSRIVGGDALGTWVSPEFARLEDLVKEAEAAYLSRHYERRFAWIDNVRVVRDKTAIAALHALTAQSVKSGRVPDLAPPEVIDWKRVSNFTYSIDPVQSFPELRFADYRRLLKNWLNNKRSGQALSFAELKSQHVEARNEAGETAYQWSILSCLDLELKHNGGTYLLVGGDYFVVSDDYISELDDAIGGFKESKVKLPNGKAGQRENSYNDAAATALHALNMDAKTVKARTTTTAIEVCDLLTSKRELIHVKRDLGSANLSHLFAQGYVSADLLLSSVEFRRAALKKIRSLESKPGQFSALFSESSFVSAEFEVVYGIITEWRGRTLQQALPFFSKVTLRRCMEDLRRLQYRASYRRINCA